MVKPATVIGWTLDRTERAHLLELFPPRYTVPVADHVTLLTGAADEPLPARVDSAIVGHVDDGTGVEAMVASIDGATERPDGSTFHLTWSLGVDRRAVESNDVIRACGWTRFDRPVPITLVPARF